MTGATGRARIRYLWAVLLTLLTPGSGQVYAGRARRGWLFAGAIFALLITARLVTSATSPTPVAAALFLSAIGTAYCLMLVVLFDAVRLGRLARSPIVRPWTRSVWPLVVAQYTMYLAFSFIALPTPWNNFATPSASSEPTLLPGDYFFADMSAKGRAPHVGDLMAFLDPRHSGVIYIKRVVGLGGDRIQIKNGVLYLNGMAVPRMARGFYASTAEAGVTIATTRFTETLPNGVSYDILKFSDEPAAAALDANNTPEYTVPPGDMFMLGDNRDNSMNSRFQNGMGYVPVANAVGRAGVIYFSNGQSGIRWNRLLQQVH